MNAEAPKAEHPSSRFAICDCGRRLPKTHLAHHKRHSCPTVPREGHCAYCRQPAVFAMLEKFRDGMVIEEVAQALGHQPEYVQEVRTRARGHGCLPPAPKKGSPEYVAERERRAKFTMGERTCLECGKSFIPSLGSVHQNACSSECSTERRNRLKREAWEKKHGAAKSESPPAPPAPPPEDKEAQYMAPREQAEAEIVAMAEAQGRRILATRERQHVLWCECLGVAA